MAAADPGRAAAAAPGLLGDLESTGALRRGHFLLSSGLHSPAYVQCARLLEEPARTDRLAALLAERLAPQAPQSVLSPALGGLVIGYAVAARLGVPFRFVERAAGEMRLRRGFELTAGERVVVVEDVVTTGCSTLEAVAVAEARGAEVVAVGAILDRTGARKVFQVPFASLERLELPTWPASECPLCAAGGAPEKPGSRAATPPAG